MLNEVLKDINSKGSVRSSVLDQLKTVVNEPLPNLETHGEHWNEQMSRNWAGFNLREQAELLQTLLLSLQQVINNIHLFV